MRFSPRLFPLLLTSRPHASPSFFLVVDQWDGCVNTWMRACTISIPPPPFFLLLLLLTRGIHGSIREYACLHDPPPLFFSFVVDHWDTWVDTWMRARACTRGHLRCPSVMMTFDERHRTPLCPASPFFTF